MVLYVMGLGPDALAHSADPGIYQAWGQGVTHPHPCTACFSAEFYSTAVDKCILQLGQIHLSIWTNTVCNLDKYIVQFGEIQRVYCSRAPPLTKDEHGPQCSGLLGRLCYSPEWILQGFVGVFVFSYFVVFVFSCFVFYYFVVFVFYYFVVFVFSYFAVFVFSYLK